MSGLGRPLLTLRSTGRLCLVVLVSLALQSEASSRKKLAERLENPRVPADKPSGYDAVYKIKLRSAGYRLAYEVIDDALFVYVLVVGKREKGKAYPSLTKRR